MKINIVHLYPDLLNLYGDRGNIATLEYRAKKRGIEVTVQKIGLDDKIDFDSADIIYLGGGSEKEQKIVCESLAKSKDQLKDYIENGGCMLAVCSGYEILGKYCKMQVETLNCLDILDIYTEYSEIRLIGNVVLNSELLASTVVGFENHGGRTYTGDYEPLGTVQSGYGNNGEDKKEGVVYKNTIATYIHGPLLPKNPALADHIITSALSKKYDENITLEPIDDSIENMAHEYCVERFK